jgi:hypothetical protein
MADIPSLIRRLIAGPITSALGGLRVPNVQWTPIVGRDMYGPTYASAPTKVTALVEEVSENVASMDGTMKLSSLKLTFFGPVDIHEGDLITLKGRTTTVVKVGGLLDPEGDPYLPEVWTGRT